MLEEKPKRAFLWHMESGYAKIIEKGIKVGGRFQEVAERHEANKRKHKTGPRQGFIGFQETDRGD